MAEEKVSPIVQVLSYVDIQHDALAVFDDVEQGVITSEDIWVSGYQCGSSSVHGKVKVAAQDGGGSSLTPRDGVNLTRTSKTTFVVDIPSLGIEGRAIKFPRQALHPPYKKKKTTSAPLHINSIALSSQNQELVAGGPDGFCAVMSASASSTGTTGVEMTGHVGDVLDCRWFPSGQVVLSSSSDLSIRVFASKDGANPRLLKGHTRAITSTYILGVGKEVMSASKDGTIRLWNVAEGREKRQWTVEGKRAAESMLVLEGGESLKNLGLREEQDDRVMLVATKDGVSITPWSSKGWFVPNPEQVGHLVSFAYSPDLDIIATGHSSGIIALRPLSSLLPESDTPSKLIRRNESPVYSLLFSSSDLYMGTAAGLPCRLSVERRESGIEVSVKEELAGWEAVGVGCWAEGHGSVWCAGGEGGIRRY